MKPTQNYEGILYPDLLIAFDVDAEANIARNGYLIPEQGKPPDFVLEVASETTAHRDETVKRDAYEAMDVLEYWRFDPTGGKRYQAPLAGDRLVGEAFAPIATHRTDEGHYWGHSEALSLSLCWEEGNLRFWDSESRAYLPTFQEERANLQAAELRAETAETRANSAETRAAAAEGRGAPAERRAATSSVAIGASMPWLRPHSSRPSDDGPLANVGRLAEAD